MCCVVVNWAAVVIVVFQPDLNDLHTADGENKRKGNCAPGDGM